MFLRILLCSICVGVVVDAVCPRNRAIGSYTFRQAHASRGGGRGHSGGGGGGGGGNPPPPPPPPPPGTGGSEPTNCPDGDSHHPPTKPVPDCDNRQGSEDLMYRRIDGVCNNFAKPFLGAVTTPFDRFMAAEYEDGTGSIKTTRDGDLPNPRSVSVASMAGMDEDVRSTIASNLAVVMAQFVDHDITLTLASEAPETETCCEQGTETESSGPDCLMIDVTADAHYQNQSTPKSCLKFVRSQKSTCFDPNHKREQVNGITALIDLSPLYGSDAATLADLRHTSDGLLKVYGERSESLTSTCNPDTCNYPFLPVSSDTNDFQTGEVRGNENGYLISVHAFYVRLHNGLAKKLKAKHSDWNDEKLFQETRRITIALHQKMIYGEFLPVILGQTAMDAHCLSLDCPDYAYKQEVRPNIWNMFATAAYRWGHAMHHANILSGEPSIGINVRGLELNLRDNQFVQSQSDGSTWFASKIMRGVTFRPPKAFDSFVAKPLTHFLPDGTAGTSESDTGSDLVARNIQRGREHGIPSYVDVRAECFPEEGRFESFADVPESVMTTDTKTRLSTAYDGKIKNVDFFIGGIGEVKTSDGILGPTFTCVLAQQFRRLKEGDRFWYQNTVSLQNSFTTTQMEEIGKTTFASIMCDCAFSDLMPTIQKEAFKIASFIPGDPNVAVDCNQINTDAPAFSTLIDHF